MMMTLTHVRENTPFAGLPGRERCLCAVELKRENRVAPYGAAEPREPRLATL